MDLSAIPTLLATSRELATARWRQLAAAIGLTALLGAVLWFLLVKVTGSVSGGAGDGGMPSKGGIFLSLTIAWAILVSAFVVPMAASTAAIADEGDDSALGWLRGALRSLPWMWLRLAIPTLPLLLLGLWAINDLFGALSDIAASMEAAASGASAEPKEPLSFRVAELLFGSAPARWAAFATILGLWFMWSATRATGRDDGALPHAPWRLFDRSPLVVAALAGITAVVLGPLLGKALGSLGDGLGSVMGGATEVSGDGVSTVAVLVVGMVISAFIGIVAIPWIALFREEDGLVARTRDEATPEPGAALQPAQDAAAYDASTHAAQATAVAAHQPAPMPAAAQGVPAAVHQVVDQSHLAAPGVPAGAWWYLQAGAQVMVQVAAGHDTTTVSPVASDASGAWLDMHATGQPGAAAVVVPALGWYLLGAWNSGAENAQVTMRFTLPVDAQPAPPQQGHQAAG